MSGDPAIAIALTGNLGQSIYFTVAVTEIIGNRAGVTLTLDFISLLVALVIAISGQATPRFWLGLMAIVVFGVWYGCVAILGADTWQGYILPVIVPNYYAVPELKPIV
ncbi:ABC transporter permease family protein [Sulfitobacter guttiformis]|uniref:hypothetical protein n=1 Tax=Sulfitobacter guttiformis TaxID=74349 RepID=UPI0004687D47|nr:hypothetical protein [Sulfitobacter guttiformis]KIN72693.1 Binding-protein-dependent transport system inner membrane component [Sulfitobacter guttiformis KCTC 32187]